MEHEHKGINPNVLYDKVVLGMEKDLGSKLWGKVPQSIENIPELITRKTNKTSKETLNKLVDVLRDFHQTNNVYSEKVEANLLKIKNGSVFVGHQPVLLGGPGFIANKIAALSAITDELAKHNIHFAPIFMIGDYDGLQKELGRTYYPNPISGNATILDAERAIDVPDDTVIHSVNVPDEKWFLEILAQLESSFNGFKKQVKVSDKRKILEERFSHIASFLRLTHSYSKTFPDFFVKVWGYLTNKLNDYGIVFLPTSLPTIRKLYGSALFKMAQNHEIYVHEFNETYNWISSLGYHPTLPKRDLKYLPFFYECPCTQFRVPLEINGNNGHGKCKNCGHTIDIPIDELDSFMNHIEKIGPRVDSSQVAFQDLLNIQVRISGPGEIAYYTIVSPAVRAAGFETPVFFKYKRVFYNTPWNEKLGKLLAQRKQPSLHTSELFKLVRKRIDAIKNDDLDNFRDAEISMDRFINATFQNLGKYRTKLDAQKYLSWMFGQFAPQKFGQEVSWVWIDMALQTGLNDYIPTYRRLYHKYSIPGLKQFINTMT